jgi:RNA polymerase sigma-70 factor, ECF subfamily
MQTELIRQADRVTPSPCTNKGAAECSEEELVAEARGGSRVAFKEFVERYTAMVFGLVRRITHSREDAEDAIQQNFQKAFVHLQSFEVRPSFSTWLTRIALNEALMSRRRDRRLRDVSIDDSSMTAAITLRLEIADSRPNPEHAYFEQRRHRLLISALNELMPGIGIALQFCELNEWSLRETARALGISVTAVKSRAIRGRRKLREMLKQNLATTAT